MDPSGWEYRALNHLPSQFPPFISPTISSFFGKQRADEHSPVSFQSLESALKDLKIK